MSRVAIFEAILTPTPEHEYFVFSVETSDSASLRVDSITLEGSSSNPKHLVVRYQRTHLFAGKMPACKVIQNQYVRASEGTVHSAGPSGFTGDIPCYKA